MIFPLPDPDRAFRARWCMKVRVAHALWRRACVEHTAAAYRRQVVALRVLDALYRQRDAIVAGHRDPSYS